MTRSTIKSFVIAAALLAGTMCGMGGCSLRSIGAGLLSEFLTTGGNSTLGQILTTGAGDLLGQITGAGT